MLGRSIALVAIFASGLAACTSSQIVAAGQNFSCNLDPGQCQAARVRAQQERQYQLALQQEVTQAQAAQAQQDAQAKEQARQNQSQLDHDKRQAEWVAHPHWATTKALGPVNAAIVCANYSEVDSFFHIWVQYEENTFMDSIRPGQNALMRGDTVKPNPADYGCTMLPIGTRVLVNVSNIVPIVTVKIHGKTLSGVTMAGFLKFESTP